MQYHFCDKVGLPIQTMRPVAVARLRRSNPYLGSRREQGDMTNKHDETFYCSTGPALINNYAYVPPLNKYKATFSN